MQCRSERSGSHSAPLRDLRCPPGRRESSFRQVGKPAPRPLPRPLPWARRTSSAWVIHGPCSSRPSCFCPGPEPGPSVIPVHGAVLANRVHQGLGSSPPDRGPRRCGGPPDPGLPRTLPRRRRGFGKAVRVQDNAVAGPKVDPSLLEHDVREDPRTGPPDSSRSADPILLRRRGRK